jgi:predicted dehydrogenase
MKKKLKCAVVGCGWIAEQAHLPVLKRIPGVEVIAVCDKDQDKLSKIAARFKIPGRYTEFATLLKAVPVDFVDICTPPQTHRELAEAAIRADRHVLMEKPLATSRTEAEAVISLAKSRNIKLGLIHNFIFNPVVSKALAFVNAGAIGKINSVEMISRYPAKWMLKDSASWRHSLPGGLFFDLCSHPIYLTSSFLGKIRRVKAVADKRSEYSWVKQDELKVVLEAEKGLASFSVSCNAPKRSFKMEIAGEKGSLQLDCFNLSLIKLSGSRDSTLGWLFDRMTAGRQSVLSMFKNRISGARWYSSGHTELINNFVDAVGTDTRPLITGEDNLACISVIEDIFRQIA